MPEKIIHLFVGENLYTLEKELQRWKKAFISKHGSENFLELSGKDSSVSELLDAVSVMPFIAEKRLVVIRGIPRIEKDDYKSFVASIHPQTLVVIVDPKPDKRLGITKEVLSTSQEKLFNPLTPSELYSWASSLVEEQGSSIDRSTFDFLVSITGSDQWTLDAELKKLTSHANSSPVTRSHVDLLSIPSGEKVVWRLTELLGSRRADEAMQFLHRQLERGEDPYGLWVILLGMVKNLVLAWSAVQEGNTDERSIASAFSIHFLTVRGVLPLAKSMNRARITKLVTWCSDADIGLKSGGFHYTTERQNELISLIERLIIACR